MLKPDSLFVNGDRYAWDDVGEHTRLNQQEISGYFKVFGELERLDLLEHWIVHLFNDESENHIMRTSFALQQLTAAGFFEVTLAHRMDVNALVTARKSVNGQ